MARSAISQPAWAISYGASHISFNNTARRAISYGESHISLKKGSEVALPPLQMVCYSASAAEIAFSVFARMLSIEMVQPAARSASVALPSVRAVEATSSAVLPTA